MRIGARQCVMRYPHKDALSVKQTKGFFPFNPAGFAVYYIAEERSKTIIKSSRIPFCPFTILFLVANFKISIIFRNFNAILGLRNCLESSMQLF